MKKWIEAARLRSLPLSLACILVGNALAQDGDFSWVIFFFTCLTTVCLQILSNYANDLGDFKNGGDSDLRIGPPRAVQSGSISEVQMKTAVYVLASASFLSGIVLLYLAFADRWHIFFVFLGLGIAAILAAYFYTAGAKPYGYQGFGDVSVFVFFGLVGVLGSMFLQTKQLDISSILPAMGIGALSTGVLNINNLRDEASDRATNKITMVVKHGRSWGNRYHWYLTFAAITAFLAYSFLNAQWLIAAFTVAFSAIFIEIALKTTQSSNPDSQLKRLALSTFAYSLVFFLAHYFH